MTADPVLLATEADIPDVPGTLEIRAVTEPYPFLKSPQRPDEIGRLGNYRVLKLLSQGGMAYVFLAEDLHLRRRVALKVMKPSLDRDLAGCQRFLREARLLASIKHDHVVTVYQVGQEAPTVFLAMEWLRGQTLDDWITLHGPPDVPQTLRLAREITTGLDVVHRSGLIHRDLKPCNLWVENPGSRIKLLDFGLVRSVEDDARFTGTGFILGTPGYMSPEQARGEALDARSDLFSLGAVLYFVCTGREPFHAGTSVGTLTSVVLDHPRNVGEVNPRLPQGLADLIMQLLEKKAANRPDSAHSVIRRLQAMEKSVAASATAVTVPPALVEPLTGDQPDETDIISRLPAPRGNSGSPRRLKRTLLMTVAASLALFIPAGMYFSPAAPNTPKPEVVKEIVKAPAPAVVPPKPVGAPAGILVLDDCDPEFREKAQFKDGLTLIDPDGKTSFRIPGFNVGGSVSSGRMVAVDAKRECVWVVEDVSRRIRRFDPTGKVTNTINLNDAGIGIALEPKTGNIWVLLSSGYLNTGKTAVYSPEGKLLSTYPIHGLDIVHDSKSGAFWVAAQSLDKVNVNGQVLSSTPLNCWAASSVDVEPGTGNVWVAIRSHPDLPDSKNQVCKYDTDGNRLALINMGQLSPFKISVDRTNNSLWVANYHGAVQRFSSEGKFQFEHNVTSLAVQADPRGRDVWVVTPDETQKMTAAGEVTKRIRHASRTESAWIAAWE